MFILYRLVILAFVFVVCATVIFAGYLPWREDVAVNALKTQRPNSQTQFQYLPFASKDSAYIAEKWLAGAGGNADEAEREIKKSLQNRPLNASSWLVLAEINQRQGNEELANKYVQNALNIWPNRWPVAWKSAMLAILLGEKEQALDGLSSYARSRPDHLHRVAVLSARLEPDPNKMIEAFLEGGKPGRFNKDFFREKLLLYSIEQKNNQLGSAVWTIYHNKSVSDPTALQYLNYLVRNNYRDQAAQVWQQMGYENPYEQITNGGFEEKLTSYGFGWIHSEVKGAKLDRDKEIFFSGAHSLRIDFDGTQNIDFNNLWQRIPVEPNGRYRLSGLWRGAYITTRANPYVEFISLGSTNNARTRSESRRLTWDWAPFELDLVIPEDSVFASVRLRRNKTDSLDNQLLGTIWLDNISVKRITTTN